MDIPVLLSTKSFWPEIQTMGRLDAVAKKKVIELRESGLSFRKIKAVLELENIKVSAQAIYLFLKEFHGRPPGRVRPLEAGSSSSSAQIQPLAGTSQETRSSIWVQNLCREASCHGNFIVNRKFTEETSTNPEADVNLPRKIQGSSQMETQHNEDKEEKGIQIVSVTSLAQKNQQINHQSTATRAEMTSRSFALTPGAFIRRRNTPSTSNAILAARKRLLDKALSQRVKVTLHNISPESVSVANQIPQYNVELFNPQAKYISVCEETKMSDLLLKNSIIYLWR